MLTLLTVEDKLPVRISERITALFRPYRIETEIQNAGDVRLMKMKYFRRRGEIDFDKIYEICIGKRKTLLCNKNIIPDDTPFSRFDDREFKCILMDNFICSVLENADISPSSLRISYYDPRAEYPSLVEKLTHFSSIMTVVSDMPRFYENEAERLAKEYGASVSVSNDTADLSPCDILISPAVIKESLPTMQETPVFTVEEPAAPCRGMIITDYHSALPEEYSALKNEEVNDEYILAALYSLCGKKELGKTVPFSCSNLTNVFTPDGATRMIKAACEKK